MKKTLTVFPGFFFFSCYSQVTAYGGELRYTVQYSPSPRSLVIDGQPDVVIQGNGIFLEHYSGTKPQPRVPHTVTVVFREVGWLYTYTFKTNVSTYIALWDLTFLSGLQSAWRRADGQPCTREHLLMALADISAFMIRATYADNVDESRWSWKFFLVQQAIRLQKVFELNYVSIVLFFLIVSQTSGWTSLFLTPPVMNGLLKLRSVPAPRDTRDLPARCGSSLKKRSLIIHREHFL